MKSKLMISMTSYHGKRCPKPVLTNIADIADIEEINVINKHKYKYRQEQGWGRRCCMGGILGVLFCLFSAFPGGVSLAYNADIMDVTGEIKEIAEVNAMFISGEVNEINATAITDEVAEINATGITDEVLGINEVNANNDINDINYVNTPVGPIPVIEEQFEAGLLIEVDTGQVLFAKNKDKQLFPASVTKIMTALLVMEAMEEKRVRPEDEVVISIDAAAMGGSQIFLSPGDRVTLDELLLGLMVGSANDAAVAIAEHVSGSLETFVEDMNRKAGELGMENTSFCNPHGLHDGNHYSTAADISIMSRELLRRYPVIHDYSTLWMDEHFLEGKIEAGEVYLSNTNKLVKYLKGCDGLKTGFTNEAGHCIVATVKRDDTRFLAVILKGHTGDDRYEAAKNLLNFGFAHYQTVPLIRKGEMVATLPVEKGVYAAVNVIAADDFSLLCPRGESVEPEKEIILPARLSAPLKKGEKVGILKASYDGQEEETELVASAEVPRAGYFQLAGKLFSIWFTFGR